MMIRVLLMSSLFLSNYVFSADGDSKETASPPLEIANNLEESQYRLAQWFSECLTKKIPPQWGGNMVMDALSKGSPHVALDLLRNWPQLASYRNQHGHFALLAAATLNRDIFEEIYNLAPQMLMATDENKRNCAYSAVESPNENSLKIIEFILEKAPELFLKKCPEATSPIHLAALRRGFSEEQNLEIFKILIKAHPRSLYTETYGNDSPAVFTASAASSAKLLWLIDEYPEAIKHYIVTISQQLCLSKPDMLLLLAQKLPDDLEKIVSEVRININLMSSGPQNEYSVERVNHLKNVLEQLVAK